MTFSAVKSLKLIFCMVILKRFLSIELFAYQNSNFSGTYPYVNNYMNFLELKETRWFMVP